MLTLGSTLVAGSLLLTALTALLFRRPNPPRWTRPDLVAMLVCVPITGIMALGLGYMGVGAYQLSGIDALYQIVPSVLVWAVAVVLWRLQKVLPRLRAYAAANQANAIVHPTLAGPDGPADRGPGSPAADATHLRAA